MKFYIGITDKDWFEYLNKIQPDEVNFWQPGGNVGFKVINSGEMFLFKLHYPNNYIVGGGFFVKQTFLPISITWEAFGDKNGTQNIEEFENRLYKYRGTNRTIDPDPIISSIILNQPFFFKQKNWINMDKIWNKNIQKGKSYDTETNEGKELYSEITNRIYSPHIFSEGQPQVLNEDAKRRYGKKQMILPRLGQGAFRVVVTESYHRRCAISGEKTLPVLEAAHIKPFNKKGPNKVSNGMLLRKDMHTLFDRGLITITKNHIVEVSKRIKKDYGNGREYYAFHGNKLMSVPENNKDWPAKEYLEWHNENIYVG